MQTKEQRAATKQAWRLANRDKVLAEKRRYRERHPDRVAATLKKHYEANKSKRLALARSWAFANPEKVRQSALKSIRKWRAANPDETRRLARESMAKHRSKLKLIETPEQRTVRLDKKREITKEFLKRHPNYTKETSAKYRSKYPEKKVEQWRKYYEANKEKNAEKQRKYRINNRHIHANQKHRRRARELSAFVEDCSAKIAELRKETVCNWCRNIMNKVTIDHVIPLSRGGKHESSNLVASCRSCNSKKHDKLPNEFMKEVA